ncbi:ribosomal protein S18-alanine N-acetyltransferase [Thalassotalea sp. LPB0316]|uniref:ribosomal protein S18-alanine N-acetyltransferase n=1 Tax=Thalassotalea sp. LPB0316 TaxID=2769490 RepID=UPI0018681873|nr:ribosomal protein S18-alanine N-acetyltransferase [Thalassotalea sp. LPB0316]QOL25446.1 ribosomal protein S18-alanine N-acetyltransferase [Thalassotalea sp. LPB0316]
MKLTFSPISQTTVERLMPIELACHSHPWTEKLLRSCIGGRYFGSYAELDNQVVGFYIADNVVGETTLMDICVAPDHQGQGFGTKILQHYFAQAKQRQCTTGFLEVRASNHSAKMLYINHGYIETGRRTGYYPKAVGYEDAIVMCKELS